NEWVGYSYEWNDEQTDAVLVDRAGRDRKFEIVDPKAPGGRRTQTWHYPSRAECMMCHSQSAKHVIGITTSQLNREHDYDGVRDNQLRALAHAGIVKGLEGNEWREAYVNSQVAAGKTIAASDQAWLAMTRAITATPQRRSAVQPQFGVVPEHFERF